MEATPVFDDNILTDPDSVLDRELTEEELALTQGGRPWFPPDEPETTIPDVDAVYERPTKIPFISPSQFTAFAFRMPRADGLGYENFTFEGRRHMKRPYDTNAKRILLFCGRQVEKSTLLGNIILTYSCVVPAHKTLYVSPSATQTKTFSNDRIKEPIETSPVLKAYTTSMLSQNIFEKQFVNRAKITLRYAFLNADRCAIGSTRVHFVDGSVASLLEIYAQPSRFIGRWVWSASRESLSMVSSRLEGVVDQGLRDVFTVRVEGGGENTCTANQPLLTWDGWRRVDELIEGQLVAVPRKTPPGVGNAILSEEYRLVGYLLGDGSLTTFNGVVFFNGTPSVMKEFQRCARVLKCRLGTLQDSNKKHWVHSHTKRQGIYGGAGGYKSRLRELDLIGKDHSTKRVPSVFFTGNQEQIQNFLGAIYATDGWASVSGEQFEIGYCSNSRGLLQDLKVLLLRFGVQAWISRRKKPSTIRATGAYALSIRSALSVRAFCKQIPVLGKEEEFKEVYRAACAVKRYKDDADRIPFSYPALRQYLLQAHGLSTHTAWMHHRIQLRPANQRDSVGRRVLSSIAEKLRDPYLRSLASSELGWARIESIVPAGKAQTFDLTVAATENYLVDGLFIHNTRGIPAWCLALDELQDILADNIPVIEQCTSHAPEKFKRFLYAGTPKGLDNTIEYYRSGISKSGKSMSTQGEWVVPCDAHGGDTGRYWNILGEKNIGKTGLICESCGKSIQSMHPDAQWARTVADGIFESFRIPQLMVPWRDWGDILLDYSRYGRDKFYNEVLGISYDSGMRPLSLGNVQDCCNPGLTMHPAVLETLRKSLRGINVFAGVDWGTGENSYTVACLGYYIGNKFRIFWIHRFTGEDVDPQLQVQKLVQIFRAYGVRVIGSDYGGGFSSNNILQREFGHVRLQKFQYAARAKKKVFLNQQLQRWIVHRTEVMSDVFAAIKRQQLEFPRFEEFREPYGQDMLNIHSSYNNMLRMIQYDHRPDRPDDSFHAILYCFLASMIIYPRPDIIVPKREISQVGPNIGGYSGPLDQG